MLLVMLMSQRCPRNVPEEATGWGWAGLLPPLRLCMACLFWVCWVGGAPGKVGVHACGLALTLGEALLRLLPFGVLLGLLLRVLLRGFIVSCATDGGVPVEGLRRLLQGHMVT